MNGRSGLRALLGLLVSALFLVLLLRQVDLGEVWDALRGVEWPWLVGAAVPFALGLWLRALRWRLVLRSSVELTQGEATSLVVIGYAANNLLPVRAGEVVRAVLVEQRHGGSRMQVLGTIVVERIFDGLVLALFLAVMLATAGGNDVLQLLALVMGLGFVVATAVLAWIAAAPETANRWLVRLLVVFGATSAAATAYALALHVLILLPVVIAGLVLLWKNQLGVGVLTHTDRLAATEMESVS